MEIRLEEKDHGYPSYISICRHRSQAAPPVEMRGRGSELLSCSHLQNVSDDRELTRKPQTRMVKTNCPSEQWYNWSLCCVM